jgi:uncharacterized protein YwqG
VNIPETTSPELTKLLNSMVRPVWKPVIKSGDSSEPVSKFAGVAWLPEETKWPVCPNCSKPMQLIVQLNHSTFPEESDLFGEGMLQLFYCTNSEPLCEVDCEAFFPFSKSVVVRMVDPKQNGANAIEDQVDGSLAPKIITGWEKKQDFPGWEEFEEKAEDAGADIEDMEEEIEEIYDENELTYSGDKLGGWPLWSQSPEYPECPVCGKLMSLVFQIDSDCSTEIQFGDMGTGHITRCKDHPEQVAFGWACG